MKDIMPNFNDNNLDKEENPLSNPRAYKDHLNKLKKTEKPLPHNHILKKLLECLEKRDFDALAYPKLDSLRAAYQKSNDDEEKKS